MAASNLNITALPQQQPFNPWVIPDTFTVWEYAPDYVREHLHPHWRTQKAPHPMLCYFFGLAYFTIGQSTCHFRSLSI